MRYLAGVFTVTAALGFACIGQAAEMSGSSTTPDSTTAEGHVQQHQEAVPQRDTNDSNRPKSDHDQPKRDQSAQAPQSPAVIAPPTTGDKSVITPPANGVANTPVIKPPGTSGRRDEIKPQ